jgi:XTP/dITP diphosphohydrolase
MQLLFGSNNAHKLQEIREILGKRFDILSLAERGIELEVEETAGSFEGNALLKARGYFEASGLPCFADDSGLEVAALGGDPGVDSAYYAGRPTNHARNVEKLLQALAGETRREAQFRSVIAFYDGKEAHFFEGLVKGHIAERARGSGGFGYDPVFVPEGEVLTFAEMASEAKHARSHRGKALAAFAAYIAAR